MIEVAHLTKAYGQFYAVNDVSFSVARGEVVGFLGPNGAGKSTTLKILAGFLGMTSGQVTVGGHDVVEARDAARLQLGYMPEATPLYVEMRVREYLAYRAELKRVPARERRAKVAQAMEEARVSDVAELLIGKLSKGYRQRVGLADALVARPPILILDEPTAGLDPNQIREVRDLVRALGERHTILLSTHILSEVEATCRRAIVISKGRLVAEGPLDELRKRRRSTRARVVARGTEEAARRALEGLDAQERLTVEVSGAELTLSLRWKKTEEDTARALEEAVARLVGAGLGVREATPEKATLDEVFAALTEDAREPEGDAA
ncbi:MAG: ABC transporter ATP-binding protein [Polyangiaceae bacterium]|nr:ABC transporter ATP-binding protein [Polyangiaceae bacterium]